MNGDLGQELYREARCFLPGFPRGQRDLGHVGNPGSKRPMSLASILSHFLVWANKPELREYKAVYVLSDAEIGLFSDDVVVNWAP